MDLNRLSSYGLGNRFPDLLDKGFEGGKGLVIVGMGGHFGNIFRMGDCAVGIDHKYSPGKERKGQPFDQDAISLAKAVVMGVGEGGLMGDCFGGAKALLGKGEVEAKSVSGDLVPQSGNFGVKTVGLLVANACVQRRNHAEKTGLSGGLAQRNGLEAIQDREIRGFIPSLECGPNKVDGFCFEGDSVFALHDNPRRVDGGPGEEPIPSFFIGRQARVTGIPVGCTPVFE